MDERVEKKPAVTATPIHPLIAQRWSPRAFEPQRPVSHELVTGLLEAARWAPSSGNWQPWRLLVIERGADPHGWQRAYDCLEPGNQEWVINASVLIATCADTLDRRDQPNRLAGHDVGLATENLLLQAAASGLAAHPMAGFDGAALRVAFAIPARFVPQSMIALGMPGSLAVLSEKNQTRERNARTRRALAESCFLGSWGRGYE